MKNKLVFAVHTRTAKDNPDGRRFQVDIKAGSTGNEVLYGLSALLSIVLAHENTTSDKLLSIDGLLALVRTVMNNAEVEAPHDRRVV